MELTIQTDVSRQLYNLPPAPEPWIRLHQVAASTSLAAGALAYTLSNISGRALTSAAANSVRVGGSILAHGGRILAGDVVGLGIQSGTRTVAYAIETAGESATMMGSIIASTVAAVVVGSTFLVGNTLYDTYKSSFLAKSLPEVPISCIESIDVVDELNSEYVVYHLEDMHVVPEGPNMEAVD